MTRAEILDDYRRRRDARRREKEDRAQKLALVAYARLAFVAAAVAAAWLVWETDHLSWPYVLVPVFGFLCLVAVHSGLHDRFRRVSRAERFYDNAIARLEDRWSGAGNPGEEFIDPKHPYAVDLDIFGVGSLFELVATTVSPWGAATLARWLSTPSSGDVVRKRQEAVRELSDRIALRESIASESDAIAEKGASASLAAWATAPVPPKAPAARWFALALGVANVVFAVAWLASWTSRLPLFATLLLSGALAMAYRERVRAVLSEVEEPARHLAVLSGLLGRLERETFHAPHLRALQGELAAEGEPASKQVRRLIRLIDFLDARRNQLFAPVAALLLWGTQFAFALEDFRRAAGVEVPRWLAAVGELDALLALANYSYEHPDDPFPEIVDDAVVFDAVGLGHALIPRARLVRNDVTLGHDTFRLIVVSGSNMSGKSTLLRAIGVNAVLALAGAPVTARALRISPLQIAASIRIQDSLKDGISHFYAEILRLRQVMELASNDRPLVFLLDEILHGTNSHDRRIGAEAVVRGLVERGAVGLITTHDLALSRLAETMEDVAKNVHFEDQLEDGEIRFDYVMREGVVKKSNALDLMRAIGLEV